MMAFTGKSTIGVGGLAFIAGIVATLVTAYAVLNRKPAANVVAHMQYDGWDDSLGV
jgi:hypothetical protein